MVAVVIVMTVGSGTDRSPGAFDGGCSTGDRPGSGGPVRDRDQHLDGAPGDLFGDR